MIVDSHQHFWDLERVEYPWLVPEFGPIYRTFSPDELEPQLQAAGVDSTVLVQSANSFEDTDSMLAHAAERPWIGAVVGWVPLEDPSAAARALDERYLLDPHVRGIRHLNHAESDPDWLVRPAVLEGLRVLQARDLVYEVVAVHPLHLGHVPTLARALPDLTIVVDHLAKPPIASGDYDAWKAGPRRGGRPPQRPCQDLRPQHGGRPGEMDRRRPRRAHRVRHRGLRHRPSHVRQRLARRDPCGRLCEGLDRDEPRARRARRDRRGSGRDPRRQRGHAVSDRSGDMRRFGQVIGLRPEHYDEYVAAHAAVWPTVLERITESNIRNYSIFHRDGQLFAYFEYVGDDFDGDMARMAADPETQRWWDWMMPMQEPLADRAEGEWWASMEEVFHLD